ncbi:hypothetical protein K9M48_02910 [Candidatus Gracilibacteria bacterium]|nr:hypothetical protein [Candidatus Gracilibacteria bacterium]
MFINISSDKVQIFDGKKDIFLDRNGIENIFGKTLVKINKKSPIKEIFLLNGPGGFTNLRVGTLCINLLNTLENQKIKIYDLDKFTLFKYLFSKGIIPNQGIVYIGQKKNIWIYDLNKNIYQKQELNNFNLDGKYFLDQVLDDDYYQGLDIKNMIYVSGNKDGIKVKYKSKEILISPKNLKIKAKKQVQANYFIQATTD